MPSFLAETTKNLMIKPEEVLTLNTDLNQNGEKIYYSEYLTSTNSFNNSLLAQSNTTLYNSETGITNAIESVKLLKPAKIVVLYDLLGKVLNAGDKFKNYSICVKSILKSYFALEFYWLPNNII